MACIGKEENVYNFRGEFGTRSCVSCGINLLIRLLHAICQDSCQCLWWITELVAFSFWIAEHSTVWRLSLQGLDAERCKAKKVEYLGQGNVSNNIANCVGYWATVNKTFQGVIYFRNTISFTPLSKARLWLRRFPQKLLNLKRIIYDTFFKE